MAPDLFIHLFLCYHNMKEHLFSFSKLSKFFFSSSYSTENLFITLIVLSSSFALLNACPLLLHISVLNSFDTLLFTAQLCYFYHHLACKQPCIFARKIHFCGCSLVFNGLPSFLNVTLKGNQVSHSALYFQNFDFLAFFSCSVPLGFEYLVQYYKGKLASVHMSMYMSGSVTPMYD